MVKVKESSYGSEDSPVFGTEVSYISSIELHGYKEFAKSGIEENYMKEDITFCIDWNVH
jgi:hypothetical protein